MESFGLIDLLPFIAIGFAAQLVDGALGMAFGVLSNVLLISLGVPPAAASAGVHTVETFTTCVSGISHIAHRNVDWKLLIRIVVPGVVGAATGAYLLTQVDASVAKPIVLAYLTIIGLFVLRRTHPDANRPYRAIGYPVLPAIYIVMALFIDVVLLRYKPQYTWPGLIIVLLGIPVYYIWSNRSGSAAEVTRV